MPSFATRAFQTETGYEGRTSQASETFYKWKPVSIMRFCVHAIDQATNEGPDSSSLEDKAVLRCKNFGSLPVSWMSERRPQPCFPS